MFDYLEEKYLRDSERLTNTGENMTGRIAWECPSNIALVKYWGKKPVQKPLNPSVSFALNDSRTILSMEFSTHSLNELSFSFFFNDMPHKIFHDRFHQYLNRVSLFLPFLRHMHLEVRTCNTFPHSSGIASSASSFGALALALCSLEQSGFGTLHDHKDFITKASFLARLGSGSACRSVNGGFSLWGFTGLYESSTDEAAVKLRVHPVFLDYCDSILIVQSGPKTISSSAGHHLMERHPYLEARRLQAYGNLEKLLEILHTGDQPGFAGVVEEEALTLHALMMTSRPGYFLLKPATLEIITRIVQFRMDTGLPVSFTLDAGANVHLLFSPGVKSMVQSFIKSELSLFCEEGRIIHDSAGAGPVKLSESYA